MALWLTYILQVARAVNEIVSIHKYYIYTHADTIIEFITSAILAYIELAPIKGLHSIKARFTS